MQRRGARKLRSQQPGDGQELMIPQFKGQAKMGLDFQQFDQLWETIVSGNFKQPLSADADSESSADPWVGDVIDNLKASHLVPKSDILSKLRIALILVDNAALICLKTFLKARTEEKRHLFENADFPELVALARKNTKNLISNESWSRIANLHDLRSKLNHVVPELLPKADDVDEYVELTELLLDRLFHVRIDASLLNTNTESEGLLKWSTSYPESFPHPFAAGIFGKMVTFPLTFTVKGRSSGSVRVYVKSLTQAVIFVMDQKKRVRTRGSLYFKQKEVFYSLDHSITQQLSVDDTIFSFRGVYRPRFAAEDTPFRKHIVIEYYV
ncbi:MAG TPA: hypothetical protein VFV92_08005, partial [Candidatus Bathyarchaeia archaeon]|nr:hypothetical protein [Candidatus Bathyarchaeia archaeon]